MCQIGGERMGEKKCVKETIRDIDRREAELEELVRQLVSGKIKGELFWERVKEIDARLDLRKAGQVLNAA